MSKIIFCKLFKQLMQTAELLNIKSQYTAFKNFYVCSMDITTHEAHYLYNYSCIHTHKHTTEPLVINITVLKAAVRCYYSEMSMSDMTSSCTGLIM